MKISTLLFPCRCLFCNEVIPPNKPCCNNCLKYMDIVPHKRILPSGYMCVSAFIHEGIYREAVLKYKYRQHKQHYIQFALIMSDIISKYYNDMSFDYYTSVPPHTRKRNGRPYDQVKLVAKETARLNKAVYKPLLYQAADNRSQHTLSREERIANVKNVYRCIDDININNKNILLFDDVVTTGSTLSECANMLVEHGANSVCFVTITW